MLSSFSPPLLALFLSSVPVAFAENLVEVAESAGLDTLVAAVTAADDAIATTLSEEGPFTVFAPSNAAFEHLPDGALEYLLENQEILTDVLKYHVISGEVRAADVPRRAAQETVLGEEVFLRNYEDGWWCWWGHCDQIITVNQAVVQTADVEASNGVAHVINQVLIPPSVASDNSIVQAAIDVDGEFDTLVTAVDVAGLKEILKLPGPFTVFAPTDMAFDDLEEGVLDDLIGKPRDLSNVLRYHVVLGRVLAEDAIALDGTSVRTFNGDKIDVSVVDGKLMINDAMVIQGDVKTLNGVIHVIDKVLTVPEESEVCPYEWRWLCRIFWW